MIENSSRSEKVKHRGDRHRSHSWPSPYEGRFAIKIQSDNFASRSEVDANADNPPPADTPAVGH